MSWTYNGEEITEYSQFPKNTFGFIYRITHLPSEKSYIGKKVLKNQIGKPTTVQINF